MMTLTVFLLTEFTCIVFVLIPRPGLSTVESLSTSQVPVTWRVTVSPRGGWACVLSSEGAFPSLASPACALLAQAAGGAMQDQLLVVRLLSLPAGRLTLALASGCLNRTAGCPKCEQAQACEQ